MNKFMFYLDSFIMTVSKGFSYVVTHYRQYKVENMVSKYENKQLSKSKFRRTSGKSQ